MWECNGKILMPPTCIPHFENCDHFGSWGSWHLRNLGRSLKHQILFKSSDLWTIRKSSMWATILWSWQAKLLFFHIEDHLGDQMTFNWKTWYKLENSIIFEGYRSNFRMSQSNTFWGSWCFEVLRLQSLAILGFWFLQNSRNKPLWCQSDEQ